MTVFEKIKEMNKEELRDFLYNIYYCGVHDGLDGRFDSPSGFMYQDLVDADFGSVISQLPDC